jgi:hypothetical protein
LKIECGGQTGVDHAALHWAPAEGCEVGGWCLADRRADDGTIDQRYSLSETPSRDYEQRTKWNVRDSYGTLILPRGELAGGTALTGRAARNLRRRCFVLNLERLTANSAKSLVGSRTSRHKSSTSPVRAKRTARSLWRRARVSRNIEDCDVTLVTSSVATTYFTRAARRRAGQPLRV